MIGRIKAGGGSKVNGETIKFIADSNISKGSLVEAINTFPVIGQTTSSNTTLGMNLERMTDHTFIQFSNNSNNVLAITKFTIGSNGTLTRNFDNRQISSIYCNPNGERKFIKIDDDTFIFIYSKSSTYEVYATLHKLSTNFSKTVQISSSSAQGYYVGGCLLNNNKVYVNAAPLSGSYSYQYILDISNNDIVVDSTNNIYGQKVTSVYAKQVSENKLFEIYSSGGVYYNYIDLSNMTSLGSTSIPTFSSPIEMGNNIIIGKSGNSYTLKAIQILENEVIIGNSITLSNLSNITSNLFQKSDNEVMYMGVNTHCYYGSNSSYGYYQELQMCVLKNEGVLLKKTFYSKIYNDVKESFKDFINYFAKADMVYGYLLTLNVRNVYTINFNPKIQEVTDYIPRCFYI